MEDEALEFGNFTQEDSGPDLHLEIGKWINLSIIILGIITNSLTLAVLSKSRIGSSTTRIILIFLAATDLIVMIVELFVHYIPYYWRSQAYQTYHNDIGCAFANYVFASLLTISAWYITLMTIERFIVVWSPMKAKIICTKRSILISCCVIPVACLIIFCYLLKDMGYNKIGNYCEPKQSTKQRSAMTFTAMTQVWITLYFFIPAVIIVILNSAIVFKLRAADRFRRSMTMKSTTTSLCREESRMRVKGVKKATVLVILASVAFVVMMVPRGVITLIVMNAKWVYTAQWQAVFDTIAYQLQFLNHATNFFIYLIANDNFRSELRKLFSIKHSGIHQLISKGNMTYVMAATTRMNVPTLIISLNAQEGDKI